MSEGQAHSPLSCGVFLALTKPTQESVIGALLSRYGTNKPDNGFDERLRSEASSELWGLLSMSEVIVRLNIEDTNDTDRLMAALDAFALWCENRSAAHPEDAPAEFMMTTEHNGEELRRKLIFSDQEYASQFLVFWRSNAPSAIAS